MELKHITRLMERVARIILNNYLYIGALLIVAIIASILNYNGKTMSGLIPAYLDFSEFITNGFDLSQGKGKIINTFPMWGYGLIFSIFKSKTAIIIFQQIVTIIVLFWIDHSLKVFGWKTWSRVAYRLLTLLSFQWFYYHTILWPYSQGANLLLVSIFLLLYYLKFRKLKYLIWASFCFGTMLNFRSDYFFMGLAIPLIILFIDIIKRNKLIWWHYTLWYAMVFLLLVPWGLYSSKKSGAYLQKSSNGGHVLFISLGQLPDNKWGITPLDGDPLMKELVTANAGTKRTLSHQADTFLTRKWLELILEDKAEFLKKCNFNLNSIRKSPFYVGELSKISDGYADAVIISNLDRKMQSIADGLTVDNAWIHAFAPIRKTYEKMGLEFIMWLIIGIVVAFLFLGHGLLKKGPFVLVSSVILYQYALMVFGYYMPSYHTNVFILYEILLVFLFIEVNPIGGLFDKWTKVYNSKKILIKDE